MPFFFSAAPDPPPTAPPPPTSTGANTPNEANNKLRDTIETHEKREELQRKIDSTIEEAKKYMAQGAKGKPRADQCMKRKQIYQNQMDQLRREAEERERAPIMVEATVVVPQAQPVVPMGLPVTTSESSSSGKRTIAEMAKICESELGVSGNVMSVINQAAEQLNVKTGNRPLMEVAEECMRVMGY